MVVGFDFQSPVNRCFVPLVAPVDKRVDVCGINKNSIIFHNSLILQFAVSVKIVSLGKIGRRVYLNLRQQIDRMRRLFFFLRSIAFAYFLDNFQNFLLRGGRQLCAKSSKLNKTKGNYYNLKDGK